MQSLDKFAGPLFLCRAIGRMFSPLCEHRGKCFFYRRGCLIDSGAVSTCAVSILLKISTIPRPLCCTYPSCRVGRNPPVWCRVRSRTTRPYRRCLEEATAPGLSCPRYLFVPSLADECRSLASFTLHRVGIVEKPQSQGRVGVS